MIVNILYDKLYECVPLKIKNKSTYVIPDCCITVYNHQYYITNDLSEQYICELVNYKFVVIGYLTTNGVINKYLLSHHIEECVDLGLETFLL